MIQEITVETLHYLQTAPSVAPELYLLDVRSTWEFQKCAIPGSHHIPLDALEDYLEDIPQSRSIITICHHGIRSQSAAHILHKHGFGTVQSLRGGIHAWAQKIDQTMETY